MNRTVVGSLNSLVLLAFAGLPVGTLVAQPVAPNFNGPMLHTDSYYQVRSGNVRDWGANGDDTLDDTKAIQDAIDNCPGGVYFPPGTYYVSKAAAGNWGIRITRNNIRLSGEGPASIIKITQGATNFNMISVEGASTANPVRNFTVENLVIEGVNGAIGNRSAEVNALLRINKAENVTIRNNQFRMYGALVGGPSDRDIGESEAVYLQNTKGYMITGNVFGAANGGRATGILIDSASTFGSITHNDLSAASGIGIYAGRDVAVANNIIENKLRQGIVLDYVSTGGTPFNGTIANNVIRNCDAMAIYLLDATPTNTSTSTGNVVITGNLIDGCAKFNIGNPAGISIRGTRLPVTIVGNTIVNTGLSNSNFTTPAIGLWNNSSVTVASNTLRNCPSVGIYFGTDRTSMLNVNANSFEDVLGGVQNLYGTVILEPDNTTAALASNISVSSNTFSRSTASTLNTNFPYFIRATGGFNVNIDGNSFAGTGNTDTGILINTTSTFDTISGSITNNTFTRLRLGLGADQSKFNESLSFPAANTTKRLRIEGNHFVDCSAGLGVGGPNTAGLLSFIGPNVFSNVPTANWGVAFWQTQSTTPTYVPVSFFKFTRGLSPNLVWSDSAAPTTAPNTWRAGDTVHNTNFASGQPMGWVFNGTTWRALPALP